MKKRILLTLLVCAIGALAQLATAADIPQPFLPLKPAELITYMPPAPLGWSMLTSGGANDFNSGWVTVYVERSFKKDPPPPVPGAPVPPVPPPPVTMTVHLIDTGYKQNFAPMFKPAKGGESSSATYFQIHDYPARMIKVDDKNNILNFLIKDRFLVEIRTANLPDDDLKKMAEAFDFTKLLATADSGETNISDPVVLSRVDEFNPQNNRSYPLYWSMAPKSK